MKRFFAASALFLANLSVAQTTLQFIDKVSQQPVVNVVVFGTPIPGTQGQPYISDDSGEVTVSTPVPFIIHARHVSYVAVTDTIVDQGKQTIILLADPHQLEEVVVTGQYQPHNAANSVYRVKTITKDRIQAQGSASLGEILQTELNMRVSQDLAIGSSSLSMQGIGGQNVKILINGIPLVNRNGNGNEADLEQINLQAVEKIEIVEGPMAVNYGANALAGVINIITDREPESKAKINISIQEESAGKEYGLHKGRHIQRAGISYNFAPAWYGKVNISKNNFSGYQGIQSGRQKEWNPKDQWTTGAFVKHSFKKNNVQYGFDYLNEIINNRGKPVMSIDKDLNVFIPFAFDEKYKTQRTGHQLQMEGKINNSIYSLVVSYSGFTRLKQRVSKNLITGSENFTKNDGDQDINTFRAWVFRGTILKNFNPKLSLQTGYDINLEAAGGGRITHGKKSINDFGFFGSAEWIPLTRLTLRPGLRYAINSVYDTPPIPSLNFKYDINETTSIRIAYGRGYRAPSIRELYFEFVDTNHKVFGNEKLKPEYVHHYDAYFTKTICASKHACAFTTGIFFNDIDNMIAFGRSGKDSVIYINILKNKTMGLLLEQKLDLKNISAKAGVAYTGRYNQLSEDSSSFSSFLFSPEVNASLSYQFHRPRVKLNFFYKYTGPLKSYIASGNAITTGILEDYHWADLTASRKLFKKVDATMGVKNLFNVTRISNSNPGSGTHSGESQPLSYGRSYFISFNYSLNIQ